MRRPLARVAHIVVTAVLAYVAIGVAYRLAFEFALSPPSPTSDLPPFWSSPGAFAVWFALLAVLWPVELSEFAHGGPAGAASSFRRVVSRVFSDPSLIGPRPSPPRGRRRATPASLPAAYARR